MLQDKRTLKTKSVKREINVIEDYTEGKKDVGEGTSTATTEVKREIKSTPTPKAKVLAPVVAQFVVKDLWFVRHAQSMGNAYTGMFSPEQLRNCGLSPVGKDQAAVVKGPTELLILSPLRRAIETYVHSGLQVKRIMIADCVRELVEDPSSELDLEKWIEKETPEDLQKRVAEAVALIACQPEKKITILSHAIFLNELGKALGISMRGWMGNAQVVHYPGVKIPKSA